MDKTNMDGFKKTCFGKTIEADGQIICGKPSINLSSILTVLIQEAGRWCRSYASDLFIYWSSLQKHVDEGTIESGSHLFGFRETGVDDEGTIFHKYANYGYTPAHEYRAIWRLDINVDTEDNKISMALYEVIR